MRQETDNCDTRPKVSVDCADTEHPIAMGHHKILTWLASLRRHDASEWPFNVEAPRLKGQVPVTGRELSRQHNLL